MNSRQAVLVIGDVMLDERIEGEMTRISPEAPAPVVRASRPSYVLGGAGNVAANIAALGHKTYLLGVIGPDQAGQCLIQLCRTQGVTANLRQGISVTTTKTRITCGGQQVFRYDREESISGDSAEHLTYMMQAVASVLGPHSDVGAIVVSDYAKGVINAQLMQFLVDTRIPVFVDGKPQNRECYHWVSLLKPNFKEAVEMLPPPAAVHPVMATQDRVEQAAYMGEVLCNHLGACSVVITLGDRGAVYVDNALQTDGAVHLQAAGYQPAKSPRVVHSELPRQDCFDVTGAGDTFMAVMVDAYLAGMGMDKALLRANVAAAAAVRQHGTTVVSRDALEDAMLAQVGPAGKIMWMESLQRFIDRKRRAEHRIVFTNGTFRYLHQGHIELLRFAKQQGGTLIVGINSDRSLAELKPGKAFVPAQYRAELLAQMPDVDAVVIFDNVNVEETVKQIRPNVLVKGAEYIEKVVPGADFVARHGGEVKFAPMIDGIHASDLEG